MYVPPAAFALNLRGWAVDDIGKGTFVDLSPLVTPDPLTSLQGFVTDVNGLPVEGATVSAVSNGLTAELFRVTSALTELPDPISGTPDATKVISTLSMISPSIDPFGFNPLVPEAIDDPQALMRLRGTLKVPAAGVYAFNLFTFPAGRLTVNGVRIIDLSSLVENDFEGQYGSNTLTLPEGEVPIEIIAAKTLGFSRIRVEWGPEGGRMQAIPLDALTPAVSPYTAVTSADGAFTIPNVPSVTGNYTVKATFLGSDGVELSGASTRTAPVPAGIADVGTIQLAPTLHAVALPVHYMGLSGSPRGVDVNGQVLYVASGSAGLWRVGTSDVEHLPFRAHLELPGEANDVRVLGSFAYVAGGSAGLHVVTDAGLLSMQLFATLPLGGDARRLAVVHDDRLLVANGDGGLSIIDVSNPAAPAVLGSTPIPGGARGVDFYGGHFAAVVGSGGLTVVDVNDPASPLIVSTLPIDQANTVAVTGSTAVVATSTALVGVDLTNPLFPQTIFEDFGATGDVKMAGPLAAMAQLTATSARAAFVDLHDRAHPQVVHSVDFDSIFLETDLASLVTGIATDGTFVYVTGTQDPSSGQGFLVIGQYNRPVDPFGLPPIIFGSNIYEGAAPLTQLRESEIDVNIGAFDDVAIGSVKIFVNGQLVVTRNTPSSPQWSWTLQAPIPIGASSVTVRLEVADVGGNVTARTATLAVNPYLPSSGTSVGPFTSLPGDIATDGQSIWLTLPQNTDGFGLYRFLANADFRFATPAAGLRRSTFAAVDGQENGWVANVENNTVVVVNSLGGQVRTLSIPSPGRMFFDGTHMWVVSGSLILKKIDPNTFAEVGSFFTGGINPGLMAFDGSHLWVVNHGSNNIAKVRPSDGMVLGTIPTSANVTGVAYRWRPSLDRQWRRQHDFNRADV